MINNIYEIVEVASLVINDIYNITEMAILDFDRGTINIIDVKW